MINFSLINNNPAKILACLAIAGIIYVMPVPMAGAQDCLLDPETGECAGDAGTSAETGLLDSNLNLADSGIKTAVAQCSGVSPFSSALGSLTKSLGLPGGSLINTAVGSMGKIINTGTSGAGGTAGSALNSAVGEAGSGISGAVSSVKSGVVGAADSIVSGVGSAVGSVFQDVGVSLGSQGVADIGNYLNSFTSGGLSGIGSSISGLFSGGGGVMSAFSAITGGGNDIPVNDQMVRDTTAALKKKATCDDALSYALAYNVDLQTALTKAINFTNTGGSDGGPLFVTNQKDYYQDIAQREANSVIRAAGASGSPIARQIMPDIVRANQKQTDESFAKKIAATYDPNNCGGYLRCLSKKADPNNNEMGVFALTQGEIAERQEEAKTNATNELLAGNGILPVKKCVDERVNDETGETYCLREEVVTPGAANSAQVQQVARSPIEQIMSAGTFGQAPPRDPIDKIISDLFSPNGFASLSKRAGFAYNPNILSAAKKDIASVNNVARQNTSDYASLISEGVDLSGKIIVDLNATNKCYTDVDSALLGKNQDPLSSSEKPALGEIGNLANYSTIYNSYNSTLAGLSENPKIGTANNDVYAALAQVEVLRARQPTIAGFLENCQTIEKSVSAGTSSNPINRDGND